MLWLSEKSSDEVKNAAVKKIFTFYMTFGNPERQADHGWYPVNVNYDFI